MRLKLVLLCSLIAAVVGAGPTIAIVLLGFYSASPITITHPALLVISTYGLPTLTTLLAAIFVYRHTARRRKLQAVLTVFITVMLIVAFFFAASVVTARLMPSPSQPPRDLKPI